MDKDNTVSTAVEQLKSAGKDPSKQLPALVKLGDWYLNKAKTTSIASDFTKAAALYNAALERRRRLNKGTSDEQIRRGLVATYREFLNVFATEDKSMNVDDTQNEIRSHKEWIARERRLIKDRISSRIDTNDTQKEYAEKIYKVFHDIQDMYIRLVSMLVEECEGQLGKPPCDYAIIALGSVARMEATPFSDLEFAILYSEPTIGDKISYFRVLTHFLHLKVINFGETILPSLGIKQLNDFQSTDGDWFYDFDTPRGISFDGAMPWASKTALGRMATKDKPALELIRTPEQMAQLQEEKIAVKEGYHLADILSRPALLYGKQSLLDEYNERVAKKLNTKSTLADQCTLTVGFNRGIAQMALDVAMYHPQFSYLGQHCTVGALFDVKKQFYRLISLLLSDLGLIFDIRCPSPWHVIPELQTRGIISEIDSTNIKICLSIANEIRLKTYFANQGQKELLSPVSRYENTTELSTDPPIFRNFQEDILVRLLNTSNDMHQRCHKFSLKYFKQKEIDISLLTKASVSSSRASLRGSLYYRLQNLPKALQFFELEPEDSADYPACLNNQGIIYRMYGDHQKSVKYFEKALQVHKQNDENSNLNVLACLHNLAKSLLFTEQYAMAKIKIDEALKKHTEIYGEGEETINLSRLKETLGLIYHNLAKMDLAVETFKEVEKMQSRMSDVPDFDAIMLAVSIASSLSELDKHEESLEYIEKALRLAKKLFGEEDVSFELTKIYVEAASVFEHCNRNDEALSWYQRGLELLKRIFGDKPHPGKISCLNNMGNFYSRRYQISEAVECLKSALDQAIEVHGDQPNQTVALTLNNLGVALKRANKSEESLPYFQEANEIMNEILEPGQSHPVTSDILNNMGTIYQDLGQLDKALQCYEDVHKMNSVIYGEDCVSDAMATVCSNIACVSEELGNLPQAKEFYGKAVEIDRKISSTKNTSPGLVSSLYGLSSICELMEEPEESLKHLEEARKVARDTKSKNVMVATVLIELGIKYGEMECSDKSKMCFLEAREVAETLPKEDSRSASIVALVTEHLKK